MLAILSKLAEALTVARRAGLDLEVVRGALGQSAAASRFIADDVPALLVGDDLTSFALARCSEQLESVLVEYERKYTPQQKRPVFVSAAAGESRASNIVSLLTSAAQTGQVANVQQKKLNDDERLLAEQWLLVDRSVFEVEQVHENLAALDVLPKLTDDVLARIDAVTG